MKDKLKQRSFQKNRRAFILMIVLCMGIGFAFLSSNLTITGNTSVSGNSWNVYFTNVQVSDGSVDATVVPTTSGTNTTSIDYTVTLDKPGDFYEFTVDAVNNGTIDAMIQSINMTSLDSNVAKYLSYTATYLDETELAENDVLGADDTTTYKVRVEFKKNISASDLDEENANLTLTFGLNFVQSTIKAKKFINLVKNSALSDSSIDFTQVSSASNGNGLYVMNSTRNNTYPIYYYRGNVSNNNAKFAGFCWKIVRTTETGGTKLVYNGIPNASGQCVASGTSAQLASTSKFNENYTSPAYSGYMYGASYHGVYTNTSNNHLYGNTFTYSNGTYTLNSTHSGVDSTHHYTCFNSTGQCSTISYVFFIDKWSTAYHINLTNGKSVEDALAEMNANINNSSIKNAVDNWFANTFRVYFTNNDKDYNDYLEDTVWCNDKSMNTLDVTPHDWVGWDNTISAINNGWLPNGGSPKNKLMYSSYGRVKGGTPRVDCPNKNGSFTVVESETSNGKLTYPVGLLTADEVNLAGGQANVVVNENDYFYLYTGENWWTMSPFNFYTGSNVDCGAFEYYVKSNGSMGETGVTYSYGIRPSISLKHGVEIASGGDGTAETPYEFVVE